MKLTDTVLRAVVAFDLEVWPVIKPFLVIVVIVYILSAIMR